jgi:uncharacterized protein YjdB
MKRMTKRMTSLLPARRWLVAAALTAMACMGAEVKVIGPNKINPTGPDTLPRTIFLTVTPPGATISIGAKTQLISKLQDAGGNLITGQLITWNSANSAVASVSSSGLVTGTGTGSTQVTASSLGLGASANIIVDPAPVASIALTPRADTLQPGQTVQIVATPKDGSGNNLTGRVVTWSSGNPTAATVSSSGLVTGVAAGLSTITATSEGVNSTADITVLVIPVASVQVAPALDTLLLGAQVQLVATPRDAASNPLTGRVVTWSTLNAAVATVSSGGNVTAVTAGTTTITATSEGQSGSATVVAIPAPVATVTVTPASPSVQVGATTQLTATTRAANGTVLTGRVVTWGSGNTAAATVSGTGLVSGVAVGSAVITATSEGKNGSVTASVTNSPPTLVRVILAPDTTTVVVGKTKQFTTTGKYSDSSTAPVTPTYSATGGTISSSGLYTAGQTGGPFRAIATNAGKADTSAINVARPSVNSVVVTPNPDTIAVGKTAQLTATPKDSTGAALTGRVVTWASGNTAVATVSSSGVVTAVAAGPAVITATCETVNGTTNAFSVVVLAATVQVSPATSTVHQGTTGTLTATARDKNGAVLSGHPTTWTSLDPTVATVNASGVVTGVKLGTTTMRATVDTASGSATVQIDTVSVIQPWLSEDFSMYSSTANLLADPRGIYSTAEDVGTGQLSLDKTAGVPQLGTTQSMRYDYISPGCSTQTVGRNLVLPTDVQEIWIEVYLKWSSNFSTYAGGCSTPPAHKLLFGRVSGLNGRWEIEWGNQGPPQSIYWGYPSSGGGVQDQFGFDNAPAYWNNTWYRVRFHFKHSSSTSSSDGAFQMWVDNQLMVSRTNININVSASIYGIALGRNLDQGINSGTMSLWWGRVQLWNVYPGW